MHHAETAEPKVPDAEQGQIPGQLLRGAGRPLLRGSKPGRLGLFQKDDPIHQRNEESYLPAHSILVQLLAEG